MLSFMLICNKFTSIQESEDKSEGEAESEGDDISLHDAMSEIGKKGAAVRWGKEVYIFW